MNTLAERTFKHIEELERRIEYLREGLEYIAEDHHFDSPAESAEVAKYYLEGRTD